MNDVAPVSVGFEEGKDFDYYNKVRTEIEPFLPSVARRNCDFGCGEGHTSAWLKQKFPDAEVVGIESFPANEKVLRANVDRTIIADITQKFPNIGVIDLALFLDVLEHLPRPDVALKSTYKQMEYGARVIISVPNIANIWVNARLFFCGEFEYKDSGILDNTHMRFFVQKSAIELLEKAGFTVLAGIYTGFWKRSTRYVNYMTFGLFKNRLAYQFVLVGEKRPAVEKLQIKWYNY